MSQLQPNLTKRQMDDIESLKYATRTHFTHFSAPNLPWHKCVVCGEDGVRVWEGDWYCLDHYLTRSLEDGNEDNS